MSQTFKSWILLKWMEWRWSAHAEDLVLKIKYYFKESECGLMSSFGKKKAPQCKKHNMTSYLVLPTRSRPSPLPHLRDLWLSSACWAPWSNRGGTMGSTFPDGFHILQWKILDVVDSFGPVTWKQPCYDRHFTLETGLRVEISVLAGPIQPWCASSSCRDFFTPGPAGARMHRQVLWQHPYPMITIS